MHRVLTFKRARTYALVLIGLFLIAWMYELSSGSPPLYGDDVPIGGDYIAFHAAGRLVLTGRAHELYDRSAVVAVQDALLLGRVPGFYDGFRNPPFAALPFVPLAAFDLVTGFVLWSVVSLACLGLALWLLLADMHDLRPRWRGLLILVFAFGPVFFGLIDGQNATVSLLLFVLIYRALRRDQNRRAALFAALGLFKPQLFFLFPVVLVARRSWSALGVHALVAACLAAVSLALVGVDGAAAWVRILFEPESGQVVVNAWRMVSLKSFLDVLLPSAPLVALALYVVGGITIVAAALRLWFDRRADINTAWMFSSLAAVLVDPHLIDYDLTVLLPAGILAAKLVPATRLWMVVLYVLLVFRAHLPLGDAAIQLSTLVLLICFGVAWVSLRPRRRPGEVRGPAVQQVQCA